MNEERFMIAQPVRSLQQMLGALSRRHDCLPFLAVDGVFGEETLEAVMIFQREFCQPVTGTVDQRTWDAIVAEYQDLERERARPRQSYGFPDRPFQVIPGQTDRNMALVQVMFQSLSQVLDGIVPAPANGRHGEASVQNVKWLQRCAGLEETGVMDRFTWNMLSRMYDLFIVRGVGMADYLPAQTRE